MSAEEAMKYAREVTENACKAISDYPNSQTLMDLAEMLLNRKN